MKTLSVKSTPHNADYTKNYNRNMLLKLLRRQPMSRAEITQELGLTRAATTLISDDLIRDGLIEEKEAVSSLRGRPPKPLVLCPDAAYAIGIYLNRSGFRAGLVNFVDELVSSISMQFDSNTGTDKTGLLIEAIRQLVSDADVPTEKIIGIGISSPGPIDEVNGRILNAPRFRLWANTDLGKRLHEETGLPTYLEKDATCLAHYNMGKGLTKGSNNFLLYLMEGGVGSCIVSNGTILKSASGFTTELGHCSIYYQGRVCECGNVGCLEAYASIRALLRESAFRSWPEVVDAPDDNEMAAALLDEEAEYLSCGVITAANLTDIDTVLLAGNISYNCEKLAYRMEKIINSRWIRRNDTYIHVGKAADGPNHEIIAAADVAYAHYLSA